MLWIDPNNFEHLTGFQDDFARDVDRAVDELNLATGGRVSRIFRGDGSEPGQFMIVDDDSLDDLKAWWQDAQHPDDYEREEAKRGFVAICFVVRRAGVTTSVMVPLLFLLRGGAIDVTRWYQIYYHVLARVDGVVADGPAGYVGVTRQGWRKRWRQHLSSAASGSPYLFHRAIRDISARQVDTIHQVIMLAPNEELAMKAEEYYVDQRSLYPMGLNMIPGGAAGLRYLQKLGALRGDTANNIERRDRIIGRHLARLERAGQPNPLVAARWSDSGYATRVICGPDSRLKPYQIRDARLLHSIGVEIDSIAARVGARNVLQIRRLVANRTYARVE